MTQFIARTVNPERLPPRMRIKNHRDDAWFWSKCFYANDRFFSPGTIEPSGFGVYTAYGVPGSGKTAILKNIGANYKKFISLHDAEDGEGLDILRAHRYIKKFEKCLVIHGDDTSIRGSHNAVPISKLTLNHFFTHDGIVLDRNAFVLDALYFKAFQKVVDILMSRDPIKDYWFANVSEAQDLVSMTMMQKGMSSEQARAYIVRITRRMRHFGIAEGLDAQYMGALVKEMREFAKYTFVKNLGQFELSDDMKWLYRYFEPRGLRSLRVNEFGAVDQYGAAYVGTFHIPPWQKHPGEERSIYDDVDVHYDFGSVKPDAVPNLKSDAEVAKYEREKMHKRIVVLVDEDGKTYEQTAAILTAELHHNVARRTVEYHYKQDCGCEVEDVRPTTQGGTAA